MHETVSLYSFSSAELWWLVAVGLLVVFLPIVILGITTRFFPPVYRVPGRKSGLGGLLLMTVFILAAEAVFAGFHFFDGLGTAANIASMDRNFIWPAVQTLIPDFVSALLLSISVFALVFLRSPRALFTAALFAWLGGPMTAILRHVYLGILITWDGEPTASFLLTVVMTIYLLFSDRSALTYGTRAGRRIVDMHRFTR